MAVALCAAAFVTTVARAEDDLGIVSASPITIAEPVNPQPGMVFRGYCEGILLGDKFKKQLATTLASSSAVKTTVVKSEQFSFEPFLKEVKINQGVWEGFLKCKRTAKCTILIKQKSMRGAGFLLFVNGKKVMATWEQGAVDVDLKAGFNHIKIITQTRSPVEVFLGPTGSTNPPKPLSPNMLFHDEKSESDVI